MEGQEVEIVDKVTPTLTLHFCKVWTQKEPSFVLTLDRPEAFLASRSAGTRPNYSNGFNSSNSGNLMLIILSSVQAFDWVAPKE